MKNKSNILLVIETGGPGGAETVLFNIAHNLDSSQFNPHVALFRSGWLFDFLSEHEIKTEVIHSRHSWDISFLSRLIKHCRKLKIDLIHSHLPGANLYGCLAGAILKIPVISTFHNEMSIPGGLGRYIALKNFLIGRLAAKIVLVADYLREDYINKAKFSGEKLITIHNGIEPGKEKVAADNFALKKELGFQNDDLLIGHVANIRPAKGHEYLIEAAAVIIKEMPQAKFLLIGDEGDGTLKKTILDQIIRSGLQANMKFLGFRKDVKKLLRLIDIFVLTSISEGLPLSVVEAMAASRPVVATRVGGLSEVVMANRNGYLVEPGNATAIADKLMILLRSKTLREQMGKAGRKIVEEKFSLKAMIDNYQNLYQKLLNER